MRLILGISPKRLRAGWSITLHTIRSRASPPLKDQQQQQFVPSIDFEFGLQWEFNFGAGIGATRSTDHLIVKCIIGRAIFLDAQPLTQD